MIFFSVFSCASCFSSASCSALRVVTRFSAFCCACESSSSFVRIENTACTCCNKLDGLPYSGDSDGGVAFAVLDAVPDEVPPLDDPDALAPLDPFAPFAAPAASPAPPTVLDACVSVASC